MEVGVREAMRVEQKEPIQTGESRGAAKIACDAQAQGRREELWAPGYLLRALLVFAELTSWFWV